MKIRKRLKAGDPVTGGLQRVIVSIFPTGSVMLFGRSGVKEFVASLQGQPTPFDDGHDDMSACRRFRQKNLNAVLGAIGLPFLALAAGIMKLTVPIDTLTAWMSWPGAVP